MESSGAGSLHHQPEQSPPSSEAASEGQPQDATSTPMDGLTASPRPSTPQAPAPATPQVPAPGTPQVPAPSTPQVTVTAAPSLATAPEADPPPSYDSVLGMNQIPSQPHAPTRAPPSYASAYRQGRKVSCPAGSLGWEGEASLPRRTRKKPCVTLSIEEPSPDTWCSLAPGVSPAPSLQQQEGQVNDFRSTSGGGGGGGKSVFFYVQDETEDSSAAKGCDNLAFVADEKEGSHMEGFVPPSPSNTEPIPPEAEPGRAPPHAHAQTSTPASPPRRSSDPECLAVPREELARSQSIGNDLGAAAPQTLRKRSTSRGRPEPGSLDALADSHTSLTPALGDRPPRHLATEDTGSPSLLRKIFSSPFLGLSRSPSTRSCSARSARDECGKHRSGGHHTRPPQGPPSVRDDHLRSGGQHTRPPQGPPSVSVRDDHHRHHYMMHHHLYRNSRRNVQEKLHRQLSESDAHHHHHHGHGRGHHRSQSQRSTARPRHEALRRLNTYGHEHYLKISQELEDRCRREDTILQGREEGEAEVEAEDTAVRRVSHYRQEEKGLTDVERWVGVHGGIGDDGAETSAAASPTTPTTPHIIVSTEEDDVAESSNPKVRQPCDNSEEPCDSSASNGQVTHNGAPQASNGGPNAEEKRPKLSLTMNSLDLPDGRHPSLDYNNYRKTRRNSMNEIFRRVSGSQTNLQLPIPSHNMRRSSSRTSLEPSMVAWREEGNDSLIACVSALYGKLLVVMGMAFPVAEVISHDIPISFYNGFYLYLYIGSIVFLVYAYVFLLQTINIPTSQLKSKFQSLRSYVPIPDLNINMVFPRRENNNTNTQDGTGRMTTKDSRFDDKESDRASINTMSFKPPKYALTESNNHGSMYLKMGAVVFGIGSMIYSGLEVGQYFELQADDSCADILLVISPAARMLFTFIQMYFIFLNSRVAISRHRIIARFGLMHMIGTNLCIWLNVLVQETKHEIINIHFGHGDHHGVRGTNLSTGHHAEAAVLGGHGHGDDHGLVPHDDLGAMRNESQHDHEDHEVSNSSHTTGRLIDHGQVFSIYECSRSKLMGELVDNASPFLFPCTIEYSLLCAGVLYVVWNNINKPVVTCDGDSDISTYVARKARHHYSVDCAHANRGLFMGILILVLTIISLILFFVLINNEDYKSIAIMEGNIIELLVYGVATVTVVVGMIQMRELEFVPEGDIELDNILLLIAQTGVYIYTSFTIIGGHFTMSDRAFMVLPLLSAIITLTQTTLQTIFILDATRRCCYNHDQLERKPGREMVTFLLVCNLAMWAINTFETSRADAHPTQLNFYGIWAWTIISHISMPLAIFYRFHVTVCLCEIWKRSYKLKQEYY